MLFGADLTIDTFLYMFTSTMGCPNIETEFLSNNSDGYQRASNIRGVIFSTIYF